MKYSKDDHEHLSYILHEQHPFCWFCRRLITTELELFTCTGKCSRNYHRSCLKYHKNIILSENNRLSKDSIDYDDTRICYFCIQSYIGCSYCQNFTHENKVIKCSIKTCTNFYCKDLCMPKIRSIYFTEDDLISYFKYMKIPLDVIEVSKDNIICHSHFCYSCYDCDKYMYTWEKYWRRELSNIKSDDANIAWEFLRRTCKGSIELSYFNKGKYPTKPPRMPTLLRINLPNHTEIQILEKLRELNKLTQNTIYSCIRCDRSWCLQCFPPDGSHINNCENNILCHDCLQQQLEDEISGFTSVNNNYNHKNTEISFNLHSNAQNIYRQLKSTIVNNKGDPSYINTYLPLISNNKTKLESNNNDEINHNEVKNSVNNSRERLNIYDILPVNFIHIDSNYSTEENNKYLKIIDTPDYCNCDKVCVKNCIKRSLAIEFYDNICKLVDNDIGELSKFTNLKLYISRVDDKGYGVFASDYIYEGELLCEYTGEVITQDVYQNRLLSRCFRELDDGKQNHWYIMKIHKDVYVDSSKMGNISRYINHSCEPNCQSLPINYKGEIHMCIFSKKNINPNEEITYNYGFHSNGLFHGFSCVCGSKKCKGVIGNTTNDLSLDKTIHKKLDGSTVDTLNDLIKDMHNLFTIGTNTSLKPRPIPLDVLNGIFTCHDLEDSDNLNNIINITKHLNMCNKIRKILNNGSGIINYDEIFDMINHLKGPLTLPMELKSHNHIEYLYTKLIALNGLTLNKYLMAKTKKYAIDIPWSLIAYEYNQQKSLNITSNPDFFIAAKRFFQCYTILNVRNRHTREALSNIHRFFDLSWGITECCAACGGYGDCTVCDSCATVLHDKSSCGDFITSVNNEMLCSVCQYTNHRTRWYLKDTIEREVLAVKLYIHRLNRMILNNIKNYSNIIITNESLNNSTPHMNSQTLDILHTDVSNVVVSDISFRQYVNYIMECNRLVNDNDNFW